MEEFDLIISSGISIFLGLVIIPLLSPGKKPMAGFLLVLLNTLLTSFPAIHVLVSGSTIICLPGDAVMWPPIQECNTLENHLPNHWQNCLAFSLRKKRNTGKLMPLKFFQLQEAINPTTVNFLKQKLLTK